ncbi:MAG: hypothetical protein GY820_27640, partial [Gammaproteobacteria bacterium]|nr:hypothetical protein [Gammaproteobacteria bacterium]
MRKMEQNQQKADSKFENFRSLNKTQGFRLSYEGGQIPSIGDQLQTNSDMMHSTSSASVGMHDISCECNECLLEKMERLAKSPENRWIDASKNNRPNTNCYESVQRVGSSEPIAVVKPIEESTPEAIDQLREILHKDMINIGEKVSKIEQEVEKVETTVRELSDVVDHNIRKRDLES